MRFELRYSLQALSLALLCLSSFTESLIACPFCGEAAPSFREQIEVFDVVVFAKFNGGEKADRTNEFPGITQYEVLEVVKAGDSLLEKGDQIELSRYRESNEEGLVLLLANRVQKVLKWNLIIDMTPASFKYLSEAPGAEVPTSQRLVYFLSFLEHPDQTIASDAFSEFAIAPYEDIVPLAPIMDRVKIRNWIANPKEPAGRFVRLGLYGLLIGLCGNESDATFLQKTIIENSKDYQFGIDGMTSGYLVLAGDKGFRILERELLSDPKSTQAQVFPVLQALRFMWTYSEDDTIKPQLVISMRKMLKKHQIADLVIKDLTRWKDWESIDRIVSLYGKEDYDLPQIKRAIVRYLLVAESSRTSDAGPDSNSHVAKAQTHLKKIKQTDPNTVRQAQRYFFQ